MIATILYASKISLLKRWASFLKKNEFFISNDRIELFDFLKNYDKPIIIIIENQTFEEELEAFLAALTKHRNVKVCVLSSTPNIKEALSCLEFGVKAYGNSYMSLPSFLSLLHTLKDDKWWFYPDFIQNFPLTKTKFNIRPIKGYIESIKNLTIIRSDNEEQIAQIGDAIQEGETLIVPYKDSKAILNIAGCKLEIFGDEVLLYEKSIFMDEDIDKISPLNKDSIDYILEIIGNKSTLLKEPRQSHTNTFKESEKIYFSGFLKEYDICTSKKEGGYIIVNDKINKRDGGSLICKKKVKLLIFKDKNHIIG